MTKSLLLARRGVGGRRAPGGCRAHARPGACSEGARERVGRLPGGRVRAHAQLQHTLWPQAEALGAGLWAQGLGGPSRAHKRGRLARPQSSGECGHQRAGMAGALGSDWGPAQHAERGNAAHMSDRGLTEGGGRAGVKNKRARGGSKRGCSTDAKGGWGPQRGAPMLFAHGTWCRFGAAGSLGVLNSRRAGDTGAAAKAMAKAGRDAYVGQGGRAGERRDQNMYEKGE
jgi:hypothetical protein